MTGWNKTPTTKEFAWLLLGCLAIATYPIPFFPTTVLVLVCARGFYGKEEVDKKVKEIWKRIKMKFKLNKEEQ